MNFKNAYFSVFSLNCKIHGSSQGRNCLKTHRSLSWVTLAAHATSTVCSDCCAHIKCRAALCCPVLPLYLHQCREWQIIIPLLALLSPKTASGHMACSIGELHLLSETGCGRYCCVHRETSLRCVLRLSWRCSHTSGVARTVWWSLVLLRGGGFAGRWGDGGDLLTKEFGEWLIWLFSLNSVGTNLRGRKQAMYDGPRMEQELSDAEIARKLQEEELLVRRESATPRN